ncbi:hypothetical protein IKA15_05440 [bacterium]|nr:hypothetical protein [bacterium]
MMRLFFTLIIITFCSLPICAAETLAQQIGNIEYSLWGYEYSKEPDTERIIRIETQLFGEASSSGTLQERMEKINETLGIATEKETFSISKALEKIEADEQAADATITYPVIDRLEKEFLSKQFSHESIYKRLDRLEKRVYGAIQTGDLDSRVARLTASSTYVQTPDSPQEAYNYPQTFGRSPEFYAENGDDTLLQIAGLEMSLLGKTFGHDPLALRLNRLERKIFHRDFSTDSNLARIQRIQAASVAKKTSRYYDSNKLNKFASTGMQLGSFILMILAFIL